MGLKLNGKPSQNSNKARKLSSQRSKIQLNMNPSLVIRVEADTCQLRIRMQPVQCQYKMKNKQMPVLQHLVLDSFISRRGKQHMHFKHNQLPFSSISIFSSQFPEPLSWGSQPSSLSLGASNHSVSTLKLTKDRQIL